MFDWLDWPPWPSKKGLAPYETALLTRFGGVDDPSHSDLAAKRGEAQLALDQVNASLAGTNESARAELQASKQVLDTAIKVADVIIAASKQAGDDCAERGVAMVSSSLDLQVSKIGGLLAFNGLAVTVGTILWTNIALPTMWLWIQTVLFLSLLLSSLLTLDAIRIRWQPASKYETASAEFRQLLELTARRAWVVNIAVVLAFLSVILIALWIALGEPEAPKL